MHRTLLALACVASLATPLRADTLLVDGSGQPGTFFQLATAVSAAAEGDTLLVSVPAMDLHVVIDGKSLTIVADEGRDAPLLTGTITVRNLAVGQSLLLDGLRVEPNTVGPALFVENCAGSVLVQDTLLTGPFLPSVSTPAVRVLNAAAVVFTRCTLTGCRALGVTAGAGLRAEIGARVSAFDSTIEGGAGLLPFTGGTGAEVLGLATLFVSGGALRGGVGGDGDGVFGDTHGSDGGIGLLALNPTAQARLVALSAEGGAGGAAVPPFLPGDPGPDLVTAPGVVEHVATTPRSLTVNTPLRAGQTLVAQLSGEPFDLVFTFFSAAQAPQLLPSPAVGVKVGGPLVPSLSGGFVLPVFSLDGSGQATLTSAVASTPLTGTAYIQPVHVGTLPGGLHVNASPAAISVLADGL